MYLHEDIVSEAITHLSHIHPFFGITFLVCKQAKLPVGMPVPFAINNAEEEFLLRYYHPNPNSKFYFQPFRTSGTGRWLAPKYPSSGSQSNRTRGHLAKAFIHKRKSDLWGWHPEYIRILQEKLEQDSSGQVPAFALACWLFRNEFWESDTMPQNLIEKLFEMFDIQAQEAEKLFVTTIPDLSSPLLTFTPFRESSVLNQFELPPDALPQEGGTLRELQLRNVGPVNNMEFLPAERVSLITGDNGLGKTFILECSWWSLTGRWAERQALPHVRSESASIGFVIARRDDYPARKSLNFERTKSQWEDPRDRPTIPGLVIYARVDGSFAIWDPARHYDQLSLEAPVEQLVFSRDDVLNGLGKKIEGLIRDWVRWQNSRDQSLFQIFCRVIERLSPPDMAPLRPGESIRLPNDARDIPTIRHDYGTVAFTNESAGIRRIVTIAYLLLWAWNEHRFYSELAGKAPQESMVIMVDEMEAHLHPKWQRTIVPALLEVTNLLSEQIKPQMIVTTHSPLILASMETRFSDISDKLFHLYLSDSSGEENKEVQLSEVPFFKHGSVDSWLTSEIFELKQPRSQEGESVLESAKRLLEESTWDSGQIYEMDRKLRQTLPPEDIFWPRWLHFLNARGLKS